MINNAQVFVLESKKLRVSITNYGAHILRVEMLNRNGKWSDCVLGYETLEDYKKYDGYVGATIGRACNRIKDGRFTLHGKNYQLGLNDGDKSLHGGIHGFDKRMFVASIYDEGMLQLQYRSVDGEEGYPGTVDVIITYRTFDDTLSVTYDAVSNKDTLVNLTNHSYFNLSDTSNQLKNHTLQIQSHEFAEIDENLVTTGNFIPVADTLFDFRKPHEIYQQLQKNHPQKERANGIDHHYNFSTSSNQVVLDYPPLKRRLLVSTSMPGAQIYTANFLDKRWFRNNKEFGFRDAICIETQAMSNSINFSEGLEVILRAFEPYHEWTNYRFESYE